MAERIDSIEKIRQRVHCCACRGTIAGRVNIVALGRKATWEYPSASNVITGTSGGAVAICCDPCMDSRQPIQEAVEYRGEEVVYHPVEGLEPLPA